MKGRGIHMVCGATPFSSFKERVQIINELKKEFGKVKITVMDDVVVYEYRGKLKMNKI
jgi:phosphopantetheine adenylyltransferase